MNTLINLTPHDIQLDNGKTKKTYPKSDLIIRVIKDQTPALEPLDGFEVLDDITIGLENMPDEQPFTYYIVSALVLTEAKRLGRTDCIAPNTNLAKRNSKGHIVSVPNFIR